MATPRNSETIRHLERVWRELQRRHPELPDVLLVAADPGRREVLGWFAPERWTAVATRELTPPAAADLAAPAAPAEPPRPRVHEVLIAGSRLQDPAGVMETLLHEGAHALCRARDVVDTDKTGRRHNKKFAAAAEEMGLSVAAQGCHGLAATALTEATTEAYAEEIEQLREALAAYRSIECPGRGKAPQRLLTARCNCGKPIRLSREVFELCAPVCSACEEPFAIVEKEN